MKPSIPILFILAAFQTLSLVSCSADGSGSSFTPSIYYISKISIDKKCSDKKVIYSENGKALTKVCNDDYKKCVIEGTCALVSEKTSELKKLDTEDFNSIRIINYVALGKNNTPLFQDISESECNRGLGVKKICLDPFYTVAADLNYHKPGDVIYIDAAKGVKLPDGDIHDGFFIVRDTGSAIRGANRFDFFTGTYTSQDNENPFKAINLGSKLSLKGYRKASNKEADFTRQKRNFPSLPRK